MTPDSTIAAAGSTVFTPTELEQLAYRRFNPLPSLTAQSLAQALDGYSAGMLMSFSRLGEEIARRDETVATVKSKREEAVALRDWTVQPLDDSPAAADQAAALTGFYRRLRATHALYRHHVGGFSMLVTQMMEAVSYGYSAHHLIWKPDAAATIKLPSGRTVPTLSLTCEYVPLDFFEARTGELRFLGLDQGYTGTPLPLDEWMVTAGPCLMRAASILHYYKRLATHDLVNFSEKFGTPGLVVHTTAAQGSPEGVAAKHLANSLAGNYRGVEYGASENKIEVIWPSGGTGSGNLPMSGIIEECKRSLAILYLGADLSTMSKGGDAVGASVQGEEQQKRERADCARISETLQATIDPAVLRWHFGDGCPILAQVVIEAPVNEDKAALLLLVQGLVGLGAQIPAKDICKRLNIPLGKGTPEFFKPPVVPAPTAAAPGDEAAALAANAASGKQPEPTDLDVLLANSRDAYARAELTDQMPLLGAVTHALGAADDGLVDRMEKLYAALPHILGQVIAGSSAADVLDKISGSAAAIGLTSGANPPALTAS